MKNPLNPTKRQKQYRNRLWAEALTNNTRKTRGRMKDTAGGRCCLRVAEDLALKMLPVTYTEKYTRGKQFPGIMVSEFFGWDQYSHNSSIPLLVIPKKDDCSKSGYMERTAADVNDNGFIHLNSNKYKKGLPHSKIAECVMNTYVHPSRVEWTFEL